MNWFLKRFGYVRALEDHKRTYLRWFGDLEDETKYLKQELKRAYLREVKYSKLTLEEAEELLVACVDYHEALRSLGSTDPIQSRILKIFEKYGIKVLRNEIADEWRRSKGFNEVIEEIHGD